jgi:hypothetical protein
MDGLQDRIHHWTGAGYRVISQTPTRAQLVRPKHFNPAEFFAMPIYLLEYLGRREQQVHIAVDETGVVTETGSGTEISRYRRAQGELNATMRLFWVMAVLVVVVVVILVIQAVT